MLIVFRILEKYVAVMLIKWVLFSICVLPSALDHILSDMLLIVMVNYETFL